MNGSPNIARIGALIGDNARASMLSALMSGKALTASELAHEASITAQTASSHLSKLERGGLLTVRKQGRHKYFALAGQDIAQLLESLMGISANANTSNIITGPKDLALRSARVCYRHLAGPRGIQLYDSLLHDGHIEFTQGNLMLSDFGYRFMEEFGIDMEKLSRNRTPICRECLDWSERKSHLAGSLGRALFARFEELGWVIQENNSRVVKFTRKGGLAFNKTFASGHAPGDRSIAQS